MISEDVDPDDALELARERAADRDRQRMDYAHEHGAWDTPERTAQIQARERELFPEFFKDGK